MGGIELAPLMTKIKVDIKSFNTDMEKIKTSAVSKAKEVSNEMASAAKVGESMSKVGSAATKLLTVPLLAAGTAAGKLSLDLSKNMGLVATLLDGSVDQVNKRTEELKQNVYKISKDTGLATSNISEGLYQVISAFGDTADSAKILEIASKGAKAGNAGVTDSINLLSSVTKGYGDTSAKANQKVSDLAFLTAKLGQTTFPELAGAMGAVTPLAKQLNVTQEELFGTMATATGVTGNASEVSTQFRGVLQSLMAPTASMTTLMQKYGYENGEAMMKGLGLQGTIDTITAAAKESGEPLQSYIGSIEGQTLALALSGAQHDVFTEKLDKMQDATGATDEAFKRVNDTAGAKFSKAMNDAKNSLTKLGDALSPILTKSADLISDVANRIGNLKPETIDLIAKIGLTVVTMGPLLKITGSLITSYTKLKPVIAGVGSIMKGGIPLIGKFTSSLFSANTKTSALTGSLPKLTNVIGDAGLKLMNCGGIAGKLGTAMAGAATSSTGLLASLGGMAATALPWVAGAGAVAAAGYGIYKCLDKDVIPKVDLFKSKTVATFNEVSGAYDLHTIKVSDNTKQQIQAYTDLSNNAQQLSTNMYLGIDAITTENVATITGKVDSMTNSIISSAEKQKNDSVVKYQEMFNGTTAITAQEQQEILSSIDSGFESRKNKTEQLRNNLATIYQEISDNGGAITKAQQTRIDEIYNEMKTQAVQSMSSSKAEQEVILNNLNNSSTRVTAEMASNAIKEMNNIETKSVESAARKRDELVRQAGELKQIEGGIYAEKAQSIIDSANDEYDGIVKAAKNTKSEGIDKLMSSHQDLANKVDVNTGEIVSWWEKLFGTWDKWNPTSKSADIVTNHIDYYVSENRSSASGKMNHSFMANGYDYIPFDGYNARLHEGERVLTKKENEQYSDNKVFGKNKDGHITIKIPFEINGREFAIATKDYLAEELGF